MVLNYLWVAFFLIAFCIALVKLIFFQDSTVFQVLVTSTFDSAKTGFELSLGLTGVMTLWLGIMKIGERGGVVAILAKVVGPFFNRLFPEVPKNHPVFGSILMNFSANMLGLDNAATPLGLKAMKELQELNPSEDTASNAQIMFLVLNTAGLTLIPVSVLVFRSQMGSVDPSAVFIPILLGTFFSLLGGLLAVAIYQRINLFDKVIALYLGTMGLAIGGLIYYFSTISQEQIYTTIQRLLDEALVELQKTTSTVRPGGDDLIYGGNIPRWIKAANSLKARYAIHLVEKDGAAAANNALTFLAKGISSNTEDMQVLYNDKNLNPWNRNIAIGTTTGNFITAPSSTLINMMNGITYVGLIDPRLPFLADKGTTTANYAGLRNGAGTGGNTNITANTWYAKPASPLLMVTFSEMKFIEAEARFIANGGTRTSTGSTPEAYAAYLAGIGAHMDKLGVTAAEKALYLSNPQVAVGASKLSLSLIMKEKLIAMYLNPESWVDVRRYDYSSAIYPGMALPANHNPALNGQFIRRVLYPESESARNAEEVGKVTKGLAEKMFWDL